MAQPTSRRSHLAQHAYWLIPLAMPTVLLTGWLLSRKDWGGQVAQVLGVPIGIFALALAVASVPRAETGPDVARPRGSHGQPSSTRTKVAVALGILVAGAIVPLGAVVYYNRYLDLEVRFGTPVRLDQQHPAVMQPEISRPNWRGELAFTPQLAAVGQLGDCVQPARLLITPVADGQRLALVQARHDTETIVAVPEGTRRLQLEMLLDEQGQQDCVVEVTLTAGVLRR